MHGKISSFRRDLPKPAPCISCNILFKEQVYARIVQEWPHIPNFPAKIVTVKNWQTSLQSDNCLGSASNSTIQTSCGHIRHSSLPCYVRCSEVFLAQGMHRISITPAKCCGILNKNQWTKHWSKCGAKQVFTGKSIFWVVYVYITKKYHTSIHHNWTSFLGGGRWFGYCPET